MKDFLRYCRCKRDRLLVVFLTFASLLLYFLPTGQDSDKSQEGMSRCVAVVDRVDNSGLGVYGVIVQGDQELFLTINDSAFEGRQLNIFNTLMGNPEIDWQFKPGEKAYLSVAEHNGELTATLVGSFGLVTVAPFSALVGAFIYTAGRTKSK